MKSIMCVVLSLGIALAAALSPARSSAAGAFAEPIPQGSAWWIADDGVARTGWPTNGVISIEAWLQRGANPVTVDQALAFITVDVLDANGVVQPGTVSWEETEGLLIWVADDAFQPMTTYSVTVTADNDGLSEATGGFTGVGAQVVGFTVTTGSEAAPPAPTLTALAETLTASTSTCCDDGVDSCETPPQLEVPVALEGVRPALLDHYRLDASIGDAGFCGWNNSTAICSFASAADEYCYTITVRSLFDGSMNQLQGCVPAAELQVDETVTMTCGNSSDGCSVVGARSTPAAPGGAAAIGLLLGCLGLTWRRRRRQSEPR